MNDLDYLRRLLARPALPGPAQADPALIARLAAARQALAPPRGHYATARIAQGVMAFRIAGARTAYPELKYACHGLARPMDWEGRLLLAEPDRVEQLLAAVAAQRGRRRAACCRALLAAWAADIEPAGPPPAYLAPGVALLDRFLRRHAGPALAGARTTAAERALLDRLG